MLGCSNPRVRVEAENIWGELGGMPSHFCPKEELEPLPACPSYTQAISVRWSTHPQPQSLSSLPLELLTISEEVGGRAEGPGGQVPGQLLQLAQQAFHFCLQVLHCLLHRLEQGKMETGWGGGRKSQGQEWCQVLLNQEQLVVQWEENWVPGDLSPPRPVPAPACFSVPQITES